MFTADDEVYTSPADNDKELDEEQGVWGAAVVLCGAGEVHRTLP